jgi:hypothetical protein
MAEALSGRVHACPAGDTGLHAVRAGQNMRARAVVLHASGSRGMRVEDSRSGWWTWGVESASGPDMSVW